MRAACKVGGWRHSLVPYVERSALGVGIFYHVLSWDPKEYNPGASVAIPSLYETSMRCTQRHNTIWTHLDGDEFIYIIGVRQRRRFMTHYVQIFVSFCDGITCENAWNGAHGLSRCLSSPCWHPALSPRKESWTQSRCSCLTHTTALMARKCKRLQA